MRQETFKKRKPKIVVIGGGTGLPVILKSLKEKDADITAIVTVADDGGSSGVLRKSFNAVPPGDLRNVLTALSEIPELQREIFQYRFRTDDRNLSGHTIGNLIISAMADMHGNIYEAIQLLAKMMHIKGHVYPAAEEPLNLHAEYVDGTRETGESKIPKKGKKIDKVSVTCVTKERPVKASRKVISAIMNADMVVLGPGSLFTSILPNIMIPDIGKALVETEAKVVYISNIMTQLGETEDLNDADHIKVLHKHLGTKFIDIALTNIGVVPSDYIEQEVNEEYLLQVEHDFKGLKAEVPMIISDDFLLLTEKSVYHNGEKVAEEIFKTAFNSQRKIKKYL
ncbi:gluconeogenesis factor YvcK family protein [Alkalibacterium kapii]|uniref:Putative gluconeogenesis factor n=1 Tax=Alkalibacterium kapii TaxID=426704 RepID=A0A511AQI5_9LACT|nr:uridine diphosphate-N-acetylglucosamine-binding protein YvcK [Alkalibacterium kapii]GEK90465.1 putative gluconeogenesis factor [Alkalibacterium kapii]